MRVSLVSVLLAVSAFGQTPDDPLAEVFERETPSAVASLMEEFREGRSYETADFPLAPREFEKFRGEMVDALVAGLDLEEWVVHSPDGKSSPIQGLYRDRMVRELDHAGVRMEARVVELPTHDEVPIVLCLPEGPGPHPAVAAFPGHGEHPLHDLVFGEESYQRGMCARLARAGFAAVAVEKVDSGYMSRDGRAGVDEKELAAFRLAMGEPIRAVQLMANLAAVEILAAHSRVDEERMGATGVSLGGWLAVQTALLNDRIRAVAEYATKTVFLPEAAGPEDFAGVGDVCHVIPGSFRLGDRNMLMLPFAPRPLLSGHGGPTDRGSHGQYEREYKQVLEAQYEALGKAENFRYEIHDAGHATDPDAVIAFFRGTL